MPVDKRIQFLTLAEGFNDPNISYITTVVDAPVAGHRVIVYNISMDGSEYLALKLALPMRISLYKDAEWL